MSIQTESSSMEMMSEINMTPFVDVILVLLIIFLVTLPVVHHTVNIDLPTGSIKKQITPSEQLKISIDKEGLYYLDNTLMSLDQLQEKLFLESQRQQKPVVLLYADKNARYEGIARVLNQIQQSGLGKVGFVMVAHP